MNCIRSLNIEYLSASTLVANTRNARTHSKKQIQQIAASIRQFGFNNPILIDRDNVVIAGHGRAEAAKQLAIETVPAIRLEHLSDDQKRAYILADNKLAELAGWDRSILAIELQHLLTIDDNLDVSVTGFEMPEIDLIIGETAPPDAADSFTDDQVLPVITYPSQLWTLGEHRLLCGDALQADSCQRLLEGDKAQLVFTDPPYNVAIPGNVSGLGKAKHENFAMASGEMSQVEFQAFLRDSLTLLAQHSTDGSIHYICMDWRHVQDLLAAGDHAYSDLKNICVWNKTNGGMGSLYRSKHELVCVFKNGTAPHINNVELGRHGRNRSNVWDYAGQTSPHAGRNEELAMHPTVKPTALVADALLDCSKRKGIVLDPFGGSGTTLLAAERTGRCARLIELEPRYVDVVIRRWQQMTGAAAIDSNTHQTFASATQQVIEGCP